MSKRLSTKVRRSFVIKSNHKELGEMLAELLKLLNIDELHIMTYKDRIDVFATKEMKPLHVELYEKYFSLSEVDTDEIEEYTRKITKDCLDDWVSDMIRGFLEPLFNFNKAEWKLCQDTKKENPHWVLLQFR